MKHPPSTGFPSPSGGAAPSAAGKEQKKNWGAGNGFKNLTRLMRIPNMCLVLKLDNGKLVSIADKQTKSQSDRAI